MTVTVQIRSISSFFNAVKLLNDANGMGNSVDPDQTSPILIWVCPI